MDMAEAAMKSMVGTLRIMSALFDENGGQLSIKVDTFEKAEDRYYVTAEVIGDEIVFTKTNGQSELYKQLKSQVS